MNWNWFVFFTYSFIKLTSPFRLFPKTKSKPVTTVVTLRSSAKFFFLENQVHCFLKIHC